MSSGIFFFVGTTAELVKMFPVMRALSERGVDFQVISSGQNDVRRSEMWPLAGVQGPDVVLWERPIRQSAAGLLTWFTRVLATGAKDMARALERFPRERRFVIVHGDTVSTLLGALLARRAGATVCHLEAGLRSFNYLKPFPEEICRVAVSRLAHVAFCPNDWAANNLQGARLEIVDTKWNTLVDALQVALASPDPAPLPDLPARYFIFVFHRQENLLDATLVRAVMKRVIEESERLACIFVMHKPTEAALSSLNLLDQLRGRANLRLVPRLPYVTFTQLLRRAEFIITDGGSNQEESFYLGTPCFVMRNETERVEGLGVNVVLGGADIAKLDAFVTDHASYRRPPVVPTTRPSAIVADWLKRASMSEQRDGAGRRCSDASQA